MTRYCGLGPAGWLLLLLLLLLLFCGGLPGGRFDVPDRLFHSVAEAWHGCMKAMGDVKELIPEFYHMPMFLLNTEQLPLGSKQGNAGPVDDVDLPPWGTLFCR